MPRPPNQLRDDRVARPDGDLYSNFSFEAVQFKLVLADPLIRRSERESAPCWRRGRSSIAPAIDY